MSQQVRDVKGFADVFDQCYMGWPLDINEWAVSGRPSRVPEPGTAYVLMITWFCANRGKAKIFPGYQARCRATYAAREVNRAGIGERKAVKEELWNIWMLEIVWFGRSKTSLIGMN